MTIDLKGLVAREVYCCVSSLVRSLADAFGQAPFECTKSPLHELVEQAYELSTPVLDYEEAVIQAGWHRHGNEWRKPRSFGYLRYPGTAVELCEVEDIDPYEWEVYEHWAVSGWLGEKLIEHGEKVDKDFAGLTVWARTTTGQAIYMDTVMTRIWRDLQEPV